MNRVSLASRLSGEGGEVAEVVVASVAFFTLIFMAVQMALWSHAAHVAQAAADQGGEIARAYGSTSAAGIAAANQYLSTVAGSLVTDPQVSASLSPGDVSVVTVTARADSILPFFDKWVTAKSVGPVEEFRATG